VEEDGVERGEEEGVEQVVCVESMKRREWSDRVACSQNAHVRSARSMRAVEPYLTIPV
jgi:hypothetical protein